MQEYLKQCVCDATANDYESMATIISDVAKWAKSDGRQFSRDELHQVVEGLVREGALHVYAYSRKDNKYIPTNYRTDVIGDLWFSSK
jgi:hypothetical protein